MSFNINLLKKERPSLSKFTNLSPNSSAGYFESLRLLWGFCLFVSSAHFNQTKTVVPWSEN